MDTFKHNISIFRKILEFKEEIIMFIQEAFRTEVFVK